MSLIGVCLTFCWLIQFSKILGIWKSSGKTVQLAGPVSSVSLFWEKTIHSRCVDSYCCFLFERMLEFLEQSPGEAQAGTCDAVLVLSAITHGQLSPAASLSLQQGCIPVVLEMDWISVLGACAQSNNNLCHVHFNQVKKVTSNTTAKPVDNLIKMFFPPLELLKDFLLFPFVFSR